MALQRPEDGVPVHAQAWEAALVGGGQTATNVDDPKIDPEVPELIKDPRCRGDGRLPAAGIPLLRPDVEGDARRF
jgi:hypothetical protein